MNELNFDITTNEDLIWCEEENFNEVLDYLEYGMHEIPFEEIMGIAPSFDIDDFEPIDFE